MVGTAKRQSASVRRHVAWLAWLFAAPLMLLVSSRAGAVENDAAPPAGPPLPSLAVQREKPAEAVPPPATSAPLAVPSAPNARPRTMKGALPPDRPIGVVGVNIAPPGGTLPPDDAATWIERQPKLEPYETLERGWGGTMYHWQATELCHQPLYFQEVNLERYGYRAGPLQPAVSAARFFTTIPLLPYLAGATPPRECVYTLGYDRPGSDVPYRRQRVPISVRGALYEGMAITGAAFVIP